MKIIGYFASLVFVTVYSATINGWALSKLWAWFIVKTFDAPPLTIPSAIGLALVVNYLIAKVDDEKNSRPYWEILLRGAMWSTIKPLLALAFGAVLKLWL